MTYLSDRTKRRLILRSTALLPKPWRIASRYRLLAELELGKARRGDIFIIGYPKSGNTWLRTMISRAYRVKYDLPDNLVLKTDELANADPRVPRFCVTNGHLTYEREVRKAFTDPASAEAFAGRPLIFLLRHPCDVAVSWYIQFTKRISPGKRELINDSLEHPVDHRTISAWDFVTHRELGLPTIIDFMNQWEPIVRGLPRHLLVRYEELRESPRETLLRVVDFAGMELAEKEIEAAVEFGRFENLQKLERSGFFTQGGMSLRKAGDSGAYKVRRGKIHGYRDDFSAAEVAQLEALVAANLSPSLGYRAAADTATQVAGSES